MFWFLGQHSAGKQRTRPFQSIKGRRRESIADSLDADLTRDIDSLTFDESADMAPGQQTPQPAGRHVHFHEWPSWESYAASSDKHIEIPSTGAAFWEYRRACFLAGVPFPTNSADEPLPEVYSVPPPPPPKPSTPYHPAPGTSIGRLEALLSEFGSAESDVAWNGGVGGVHRNLSGGKRLAKGLRLGLVIKIFRAGWVRDGTWPAGAVAPPDSPQQVAVDATGGVPPGSTLGLGAVSTLPPSTSSSLPASYNYPPPTPLPQAPHPSSSRITLEEERTSTPLSTTSATPTTMSRGGSFASRSSQEKETSMEDSAPGVGKTAGTARPDDDVVAAAPSSTVAATATATGRAGEGEGEGNHGNHQAGSRGIPTSTTTTTAHQTATTPTTPPRPRPHTQPASRTHTTTPTHLPPVPSLSPGSVLAPLAPEPTHPELLPIPVRAGERR